MLNYSSLYKHLANQTIGWLPGDTLEVYNKNLINRYDELEKYNWINNNFTYQFNSLGFRCKEFTNDPTIMFLGCSYTVGVGLPVEVIWPELVAKSLHMRCANFGIGASSCDTAFRFCHGYIDIVKPKLVILLIPPGVRCENVTNYETSNILISRPRYADFFKMWASDENNAYFNREKNILGIKMLCSERNTKLVVVDSSELNCTTSLARDLAHPGIESHSLFSKKLLEQINKSNSFINPGSVLEESQRIEL